MSEGKNIEAKIVQYLMFLSYLSSKSTQKIIIFVGINFAVLFKLGLSALISSYPFRYLNPPVERLRWELRLKTGHSEMSQGVSGTC